jgi:arsenate reductase
MTATGRRPCVLFVCVQNAGRSQIAAALARQLAGDRVDARSAGSAPAERVHANVVAAMREVGIDLGGVRPRRISDDDVAAADVVVTMGCGDACPYIPGKRYIDWQIEDPAGGGIEAARRVRGVLRLAVERLLAELVVSGAPTAR